MPENYFYNDIRISKESILIKMLKIKAGNYSGRYSPKEKKLTLISRDRDIGISVEITEDQLLGFLMMVDRDKFTAEDLANITKISRSSQVSGSKTFPRHHIIPIDVCKNSKLIAEAIKCEKFGFHANVDFNLLSVPYYAHNSSHNKYSDFVLLILEHEWSRLVDNRQETDCYFIEKTLRDVISYLEDKIKEMIKSGDGSINDIFEKY